MEALLGFRVGFWQYATFVVLFILVAAGLAAAVFVLGLPGRIAIARKHHEADAVYLMGWIGFLGRPMTGPPANRASFSRVATEEVQYQTEVG